ncbi:unnamed protein product [Agarophyton chilense]|eukprot:gb/GEZJ01001495.1/.p1 GENE.gb/GEZJ01001495.1/~~gb/GEZJ01001495.1/.p1  ORF type:complete len:626 (-),score=67.89 gb/GEZJ01001495.1/:538-2304(-)
MQHQSAWVVTEPEPAPIFPSFDAATLVPPPLHHHHHFNDIPSPTTTIVTASSPISSPPRRSVHTAEQLWQLQQLLSPSPSPTVRTKPVDALGPSCLIALYFTTLTRTLLRNRAVPIRARLSFLSPQLHYKFTQLINGKWKNVPTVQLPYASLCQAGNWLTARIGLQHPNFKNAKDTLQSTLTHAWQTRNWMCVVNLLGEGDPAMADLLECDAIAGKPLATPPQFLDRLNCHKGAPDIRCDVDGALLARQALNDVLEMLGYKAASVSAGMFRRVVSPAWKQRCAYAASHSRPNCCPFYEGGYFKKLMSHSQLYGDSAAFSVQEVLEGLDEVIKLWNNPGGMCVREAKCAAGLRYNVDKSFQSGVRSYVKARFLREAPSAIDHLRVQEQHTYQSVKNLLRIKRAKHFRCREQLDMIEATVDDIVPRFTATLGATMQPSDLDFQPFTPQPQTPPPPPLPPPSASSEPLHFHGSVTVPLQPIYPCEDAIGMVASQALGVAAVKKRKRPEFEQGLCPTTPREQKRKHAHLSLKRKEAAETALRQFLEERRGVCAQLQDLLNRTEQHGECCNCPDIGDLAAPGEFPTSANTPVA